MTSRTHYTQNNQLQLTQQPFFPFSQTTATSQMQSTSTVFSPVYNSKKSQNLKTIFVSFPSDPTSCPSRMAAVGSASLLNQKSVFPQKQQTPLHANDRPVPTPLEMKNPPPQKRWFKFPFNKNNNNPDLLLPQELRPATSSDSTATFRFNVSTTAPTHRAAATSQTTEHGTAHRLPPTVASIIQRVLLSRPSQNLAPTMPSTPSYEHRLETSALTVISQLWADSTLENRRQLWERFLSFTTERKFPIQHQQEMDWAIVMFLEHLKRENTDLKPSSVLTYAKTLAAIASRLTMMVPITRMYMSGLRATGALIPQEQAPPLPFKPHLLRLAKQALEYTSRANHNLMNERLYTLLFIMVKTASRFDEVQRLLRTQLKPLNEFELMIDWSDRTKSTRSDPNRPDTKVILRHPPGLPKEVLNVLDKWNWSTLVTYNVDWFNRWMDTALGNLQGKDAREQPLPALDNSKTKFTAHSIKAAVVTHLARLFKEEKVSGSQVSLLAKHNLQESSRMEGVSNQTLRYIRDPVLIARMNQSDLTTALIPWVLPEFPPPSPNQH